MDLVVSAGWFRNGTLNLSAKVIQTDCSRIGGIIPGFQRCQVWAGCSHRICRLHRPSIQFIFPQDWFDFFPPFPFGLNHYSLNEGNQDGSIRFDGNFWWYWITFDLNRTGEEFGWRGDVHLTATKQSHVADKKKHGTSRLLMMEKVGVVVESSALHP